YGNQLVLPSSAIAIHYGGDHIGSEAQYRKGTLYFYNNTVHFLQPQGTVNGVFLFKVSTTDETVQAWNNVFAFDPGITYPAMRIKQDVDVGYTAGGILNLGVNWITAGWADSDPWHPVPGQLNGSQNMITGTTPPVDLTTLVPLANGQAIGLAQAQLSQVAAYPVNYQIDAVTNVPSLRPNTLDLGAIGSGSVSPPSTYTMGGNVSGLAGSGLVLMLNGSASLPVSANGAFTFPNGLTSGTAYAVIVGTQPSTPAQTCTVANASGTIASTNVTNIAVTCTTPPPPPTYTVGGNVSGLAGSGLVLKLNGSASLSASANGTFTFPNGLASGFAYAVSVGTQPSTPAQTCTVANGSGTIASARITNVTVTCTATTRIYTVGGKISGLAGSGLVLKLNGSASLPVSANGAFTFPNGLANSTAYAVTVGTQPSTPAQTCTVAKGSGKIASANVTNVVVTCTTATPAPTYTVGGNISGLAGSGLVLKLNGSASLSASANGAFTFPNGLTSGTAYAVTVGTQPSTPAQTCTIANGSGAIASAKVTNVAVTCTTPPPPPTPTYTVGGNVSGLAGSGLVLMLNGSASLPASANGAFTFPSGLTSGTAYAVTVGAQPSAPAQTCMVANGSGTIASANASNVAVTCTTTPPPPPPPPSLVSQPCVPSGLGIDYQVGPGAGQLASLDQVPWENLAAGDTVRIFYRATPYTGKVAINAHGTAS
ncbi:hypothetical protein, partial [Dokdonella soli]